MLRVDTETDGQIGARHRSRILSCLKSTPIRSLIISDYCKGLLDRHMLADALAHVRAQGMPSVVDSKSTDYSALTDALVITPNRAEAAAALGVRPTAKSPKEIISALRGKYSLRNILLKLGADGMLLSMEDNPEIFEYPAQNATPLDVTGAGDAVCAALAAALARGWPLPEAVAAASAAAAQVVAKFGPSAAMTPLEKKSETGQSTEDLITGIRLATAL